LDFDSIAAATAMIADCDLPISTMKIIEGIYELDTDIDIVFLTYLSYFNDCDHS